MRDLITCLILIQATVATTLSIVTMKEVHDLEKDYQQTKMNAIVMHQTLQSLIMNLQGPQNSSVAKLDQE
jgi:hypothetical protein